jgi:hypothetical protein
LSLGNAALFGESVATGDGDQQSGDCEGVLHLKNLLGANQTEKLGANQIQNGVWVTSTQAC